MGLPSKLSITNSNYSGLGKDMENWETVRYSLDLPVLKGATISTDIGLRQSVEWDKEGYLTFGHSAAFEVKYKQKLTEHTRAYARYRAYGKNSQIRIAAGASVPLSDEFGIYGDIHKSFMFSPDEEKPKVKTGGWVGFDYNPKWANGLNIWVEPVQINSNGEELTVSGNLGTSINIHEASKWFNKQQLR